jgi:hypothetical protein
MDDIQKFIEFYAQFGINLKVKTEADGRKTIIMRVENIAGEEGVTISDKISGYVNNYMDIAFDSMGRFQSVGLWRDLY